MRPTQRITLLDNVVQHYDWGSATRIHQLLGTVPDGLPAAELWLGAHPSAPSRLLDPASNPQTSLVDLVRADPDGTLGRRVADRFGPRLPYLLKVLAADRALSLQVHPKPHAARAGFNRENRLGLPAGSPKRSFHDDQHKPEMIVALSPFEALAGFRPPRILLRVLDGLTGPLVEEVRRTVTADRSARGIRAAFSGLVAARGDERCRADVEATVASVRDRLRRGSAAEPADATVVMLADQHPGDPGAIASLMLNRVTLAPGEAMYTPAGEVHAYLSGLGVEIMASSDNVIRAGLTTKHVDEEGLIACASFEPRPPTAPLVRITGSRSRVTTYRAPVPEFALTLADVQQDDPVDLPADGPRIVLSLGGELELSCRTGATRLAHGRSVFVAHDAGAVVLTGSGRAVCAWVP